MTGWNLWNGLERPRWLQLRRPRGKYRLSGSDVFTSLMCHHWLTGLRKPRHCITGRPHIDQWTIQKWPKDSNPRPQWCFSHLNQVADFDYGSYGWVCIYSTMYPRELRSKVSEWTCPIFFFLEKNLVNHSQLLANSSFFSWVGWGVCK